MQRSIRQGKGRFEDAHQHQHPQLFLGKESNQPSLLGDDCIFIILSDCDDCISREAVVAKGFSGTTVAPRTNRATATIHTYLLLLLYNTPVFAPPSPV